MKITIRPITTEDEPFLWEMLYHAIYVPEGQSAPAREVIRSPELARYVVGWGREGDCGFLAAGAADKPLGAVWLRLMQGENQGYGYVDDNTAELSMAVLPEYRGRGIGSQLLTHLFASTCANPTVSLSVSIGNPARYLYERFGFIVAGHSGPSLTMKRDA